MAQAEELHMVWRNHLEVVFVGLGNNKPHFDALFSRMSPCWLAIPHEDQYARDLFIQPFSVPFNGLRRNCSSVFSVYGPNAFPFTNDVLYQIRVNDEMFWKEIVINKCSYWGGKFPLTTLLGNYVFSSNGNKASQMFVLASI